MKTTPNNQQSAELHKMEDKHKGAAGRAASFRHGFISALLTLSAGISFGMLCHVLIRFVYNLLIAAESSVDTASISGFMVPCLAALGVSFLTAVLLKLVLKCFVWVVVEEMEVVEETAEGLFNNGEEDVEIPGLQENRNMVTALVSTGAIVSLLALTVYTLSSDEYLPFLAHFLVALVWVLVAFVLVFFPKELRRRNQGGKSTESSSAMEAQVPLLAV